ncbi:NAD(P)-dependent oxidoreductase [Variovorax sp. WS11]|uniref:SDR family NAD(P)-dependent oxidoreductase n=1 Tax=Variovorax sp. WS11 TaxID=1105204 RepID=UPI000D0CF1A6|nr:SDR family NAD(P)-dependent oxidoreductase [Variovorax sp. WS11]NDZ18155.1 SDR family oxidoreductase [Variovorax sp. WS11]PSL79752.1 NAD(P)-dependent oxidoreductase [Variovorax sp. WS11]
MVDFGMRGQVLYVTGGGSGIGRAIALMAAGGGMKVAIADAVGERAEQVAGEVRALGTEALAVALDVRDAAGCAAAAETIEARLGPIDGMVACAGVSSPMRAEAMSDEAWTRCIDVNLTGSFRSVQPVGRRMVARRRGAIVTVASIDGLGGHAGRSHYSASKHGVIGLTRAMAIEWGRHGVRVNALAPGVVDTPLVRTNLPPDHVEHAMVDRNPMARLSTSDEQAAPALFLLSAAASYINGTVLTVDGGSSAGFFTRWNGNDLGSRALQEAGVYGPPP